MNLPTISVQAWSKSSMSTLLDGCSWQWYLNKVEGLPGLDTPANIVGTTVHAALEQHERARIAWFLSGGRDGLQFGLTHQQMHEHADQTARELVGSLPHDYPWDRFEEDVHAIKRQVDAAIDNWYLQPEPTLGMTLRDRLLTMRPVAVEPYFNVAEPATGLGLHGYIDWLGYDHTTRTWVVVDHKTAGSLGRWPRGGAGHEDEAAAYAVGSQVARHLPVTGDVRMEWHVIRKTRGERSNFEPVRMVFRHVEGRDRHLLEQRLELADEVVTLADFEPNPGWNLCTPRWCPYFEGCQVTGELAPTT